MTRRLTAVAALLTLTFLSGCSRTTPPAEVEYDHSVSPYHIVKSGESVAGIAKKYGMSKQELVKLNGLKSPRIVVGQKLIIRSSASIKRKKVDVDDYEAPASEPKEVGEIQVSKLAPLTPQDESTASDAKESDESMDKVSAQPFGHPDNSSPQETETEAAAIDNDDNDTIETSTGKDDKLTDTPSSAGSYTWPVKGRIVKGFSKGGNDGINISAPKGTPVLAANNGVVARAGSQLRGFGNVVLVKHDNGFMSVYAHLDDVVVKRNDVIKAGQKIGTVGKSGNVKEPQLHFEVRKGTNPIDPTKVLN